jgi:hypothetical protein
MMAEVAFMAEAGFDVLAAWEKLLGMSIPRRLFRWSTVVLDATKGFCCGGAI